MAHTSHITQEDNKKIKSNVFLRWYQWCYSDDWYQLGLSKKIQIWILHGLVLGGCSVFLIVFLLVYLCRFLSRL